MYRFRIKYHDWEYGEEEPRMISGITPGSTYAEALDNIVKYYGEKYIEFIDYLVPYSDCTTLEISDEMLDKIDEDICW